METQSDGVVVCQQCGQKNRLRASRKGAPICGNCHQSLSVEQTGGSEAGPPGHWTNGTSRGKTPENWLGRLRPGSWLYTARARRILAVSGLIAFIVVVVAFSIFRTPGAPTTTPAEGVAPLQPGPARAAVLSPTEIFRRVSPSVFVVEVTDSQDRIIGTGSGVAVGDGQVITNKHVASRGRLGLRHGDRVWTPHRILKHPERDLALLMVDDLDVQPVRVETKVSVGDRVYAIGAPKGLELTFSEGLVSSIRESEDGRIIQTSAAISSGSSGGGLFDEHGNLVGITTGGYEEGQNLNFALPGEAVTELLTTKLPPRFLRNGTEIVEPSGPEGHGKLTIDNGTSYDATVKLADGNQVRRWVYVKAKSTVTLKAIGPCSCRVLFASGVDWDNARLRFTRDQSFTRFEDGFEFRESRLGNEYRASGFRITLHPVFQGQAPTQKIDEKEFESAKIH